MCDAGSAEWSARRQGEMLDGQAGTTSQRATVDADIGLQQSRRELWDHLCRGFSTFVLAAVVVCSAMQAAVVMMQCSAVGGSRRIETDDRKRRRAAETAGGMLRSPGGPGCCGFGRLQRLYRTMIGDRGTAGRGMARANWKKQ